MRVMHFFGSRIRYMIMFVLSGVWQVSLGQPVNEIKFERITTASGLSNNQINKFYQDQRGYLWIGTLSGLNRYDGYDVKAFYHREDDTTSLGDNTVLWMAQGHGDDLWIKSNEGVSVYDPLKEEFYYPANYLKLLQTDGAFISGLLKDSSGDLWFNINNRGIVKLSNGSNLLYFGNSRDSDFKLSSNDVTEMVSDKNGMFWLVHASGIVEVIDPLRNMVIKKYGLSEELTHKNRRWHIYVDADLDIWLYTHGDSFGLFYLNTSNGTSKLLTDEVLTSKLVRGIAQDEKNNIWIGTDHGGINILDKSNWKIQAAINDPNDPKSLGSDNISTLCKDRDGGMWVGTVKSGVNYHHRGSNNINHFKCSSNDPAFNDISSFVEDETGNLWIGTNGKGLLYFNRTTEAFQPVSDNPSVRVQQMPDVIVSLLRTSDGKLWIGSYLKGMYVFDGRTFKRKALKDIPEECSVWRLYEDSRGNIWIGTLSNGLLQYNRQSGEFRKFDQDDGLNSNYITCLKEDTYGHVWIGTGSGLSVYDPFQNSIENYSDNSKKEQIPLSNKSITCIHQDKYNNMWFGTLDGLNKFNVITNESVVFRKEDGLSSNVIMAIEEDNGGNLWLSTAHGITKITTSDSSWYFQTFERSDGLQGENFTENASLKTADGKLVFSGQNGLNIIDPDQLYESDHTIDLVLSNLFINNTRVKAGADFNGRVLLDNALPVTSDIYLKHDENSISFDFVALSFFQSGKIRYQYKLEGFDPQWVNALPDLRKASYNNLRYGEYVFRVRATDSPNSWDDTGIAINVHIRPPFWETPLAYLVYFLVLVIILYLTRQSIVKNERRKADFANQQREAERKHQLDLMKIKFFTNISHEFRTPLSLILTPIDRMIREPDKIKVPDLIMIQRNAKRLMTLVNQLLDFRKMEVNQHTLNESHGDLVGFLHDIVLSFSDLSQEKEVALRFETELKSFYTLFDKDKMEKIMFNLLSNAFKFTMPGGEIVVDLEIDSKSKSQRSVVILVSDTGIGIPEDKQPYIFNRFFQTEVSGQLLNNGTGIGLSITKEFVELHRGRIDVESKPDLGTTFTVELPLKEYKGEDSELGSRLLTRQLPDDCVDEKGNKKSAEKPSLLLVEDNFDFRFYLKDNLKLYYHVFVASNGSEAWKIIRQEVPDIVISDVMMPVMDGLTLCRKIKSDPRTSHIPVILLTAQASDQHKIEGLDSGALEYISKPFNFEILESTIKSALKFQQRVTDSQNRIEAKPSEISVESLDEKLVNKALLLVEDNMSNSEFSVEDLSHELGYSRGHFYQKILKLTGQTPIDFIRKIRMKRAEALLKKSQLNVSEVAYKVGYNNPKLFSRYFKSQYGVYPSQYRSRDASIEEGD